MGCQRNSLVDGCNSGVGVWRKDGARLNKLVWSKPRGWQLRHSPKLRLERERPIHRFATTWWRLNTREIITNATNSIWRQGLNNPGPLVVGSTNTMYIPIFGHAVLGDQSINANHHLSILRIIYPGFRVNGGFSIPGPWKLELRTVTHFNVFDYAGI